MTIPPWLNVTPKDFADAAATGAGLGIKRASVLNEAAEARGRLALESRKLMLDSMADSARIAMAGQQLAAAERQHALEAKVSQEQTQRKFLYDQQKDAIADAYKMATLGLAKTKLEDAARQSALIGVHKQGFAQAIASGMSPAEAAAKYPLAMTTGVVTQIAKPPAQSPTETETIRETYPGTDAVEASSGFFGIGAHPASPGTPAKTVTYKRPRSGESPIPPTVSTGTNVSSATFRFIRDADGNLVPATK